MSIDHERNPAAVRGAVFGRLIEIATAQIEEQEANRRQAQSEANSHIGAMESRYDTFKEDAQYLSAGYEKRIRTLSEQRTRLVTIGKEERVRPTLTEGALVEVAGANWSRMRLVIAEIALDEKYAPKGRIEVRGMQWTVATPDSREGRALVALHDAYMEEMRYLAERQAAIEMAQSVRPILERLRAAVIEAEAMEAAPTTKKIQVGAKLKNAVTALVRKGRGTNKERLKDAGNGLLGRLKGEPSLEAETRQSRKPYWEQIEEEVKVLMTRLPERHRMRVKEWKQRLEEAVGQGGVEVMQAAPTQTKPMTSEKALEWCLNGLKRTVKTNSAGLAFKRASEELRKALASQRVFQEETRTDEGAYWRQIEQVIDKRVMGGNEETLRKEHNAVVAQRVALERKGPPGPGIEFTVVRNGEEENFRVGWVG